MPLTQQLRDALSTRAVIDQALGVIMAMQGCDAEVVFGVLRSASQNQKLKLHDVATEMVAQVGEQGGRQTFR